MTSPPLTDTWSGPLVAPEVAPTSGRDLRRFAVLLAWIPVILLLDSVGRHGVSIGWQRLLGLGTWALLLVMLRGESRRTKAQVAIVVVFASVIEYTFAGALGVYVYRLHNVPWFVPPGHGLVYLGALTFGRTPWAQRHRTPLVVGTLVAGAGYAAWGAFVSARFDSLGAFWFVCLALFLWWGRHNRNATVYVGAFVIVTYLELMGTSLGTWTWQLRDPILGIVAIGNPPSGAAGGYGFFDAAALLGAPALERLVEQHSPGSPGSYALGHTEGMALEQNVLGGELEECGLDPVTGYYRDGCCSSGPDDVGSHTVCAVVTVDFLAHQLRTGNDLVTPRPEYHFAGLVAGDRWCVVAARWLDAYEDGAACPVVLASTNRRALDVVPLDALRKHAVDVPADPGSLS